MALATAALCGLAASSRASVVHFDNSGGAFLVQSATHGNYSFITNGWLDITQPGTQSGGRLPHSIVFNRGPGGGSSSGFTLDLVCPDGGASFATGGDTFTWTEGPPSTPLVSHWTGPYVFDAGEQVGPAATFDEPVRVSTRDSIGQGGDVMVFTQRGFVGVRFLLAGQTHYGYVELEPNGPGSDFFRALSWGYETQPNTPATVVPTPAGLLALASLALVAGRRRR